MLGKSVSTNPKWLNVSVSDKFTSNFYVIGKSIIYSAPSGRADKEGVHNSLLLNDAVADTLPPGIERYVQIEDYASLERTEPAARKMFINRMNENPRLDSLIFCNFSTPLKLAINLGNQFNTSERKIYTCGKYHEAIKLAVKLCADKGISVNSDEERLEFEGLHQQDSLLPLELTHDGSMDINSETLFNPFYRLNGEIFYSKPDGIVRRDHLPAFNAIWQNLRPVRKNDPHIRYILIDGSKLTDFQPKALRPYGKLLRAVHKFDPLRMHIIYNTTEKNIHASKVANAFMPFEIRTSETLREAYKLILKDQQKFQEQPPENEERRENELLEFLNDIDWNKPGVKLRVDESHPHFVTMNAIRLIKEETDSLFKERRERELELEQAAEEKQQLLKELQHRVKNSFLMVNSMINIKKTSIFSSETISVLEELGHKIHAISDLYSMLDVSKTSTSPSLQNYIGEIIEKFETAETGIEFQREIAEIYVPTDKLIPIGLIITELITNSIEHAFDTIENKKINILLKKRDYGFTLEYNDNGSGLSPSANIETANSMGQKLIQALVSQIDAVVSYPQSDGFSCRIVL